MERAWRGRCRVHAAVSRDPTQLAGMTSSFPLPFCVPIARQFVLSASLGTEVIPILIFSCGRRSGSYSARPDPRRRVAYRASPRIWKNWLCFLDSLCFVSYNSRVLVLDISPPCIALPTDFKSNSFINRGIVAVPGKL